MEADKVLKTAITLLLFINFLFLIALTIVHWHPLIDYLSGMVVLLEKYAFAFITLYFFALLGLCIAVMSFFGWLYSGIWQEDKIKEKIKKIKEKYSSYEVRELFIKEAKAEYELEKARKQIREIRE